MGIQGFKYKRDLSTSKYELGNPRDDGAVTSIFSMAMTFLVVSLL